MEVDLRPSLDQSTLSPRKPETWRPWSVCTRCWNWKQPCTVGAGVATTIRENYSSTKGQEGRNRHTERNKGQVPYDLRKTEKVTSNLGLRVPHSHPFWWQFLGVVFYEQEILITTLMMISGTDCDSFMSAQGSLSSHFLCASDHGMGTFPMPGLSQNSRLWQRGDNQGHMTKMGQSEPFPGLHLWTKMLFEEA